MICKINIEISIVRDGTEQEQISGERNHKRHKLTKYCNFKYTICTSIPFLCNYVTQQLTIKLQKAPLGLKLSHCYCSYTDIKKALQSLVLMRVC